MKRIKSYKLVISEGEKATTVLLLTKSHIQYEYGIDNCIYSWIINAQVVNRRI